MPGSRTWSVLMEWSEEGIDVPGALGATILAVTLALLMSVAFASC